MKYTLRRHYLNRRGYDDCGCCYGVGLPLYWCISDDGRYEGIMRAINRVAAKNEVRKRHPETDPRFHN